VPSIKPSGKKEVIGKGKSLQTGISQE